MCLAAVGDPGSTRARGTRLASSSGMTTSNVDHRDEQPKELMSGVLNDARDLIIAEIDKWKAEAISELKNVGEQVKIASVGFLILAVGAGLFGAAIAFGLVALRLPPWAAFGIVAIVFGALGVVFLKYRRTIARAI
jgi:hypothetical protein